MMVQAKQPWHTTVPLERLEGEAAEESGGAVGVVPGAVVAVQRVYLPVLWKIASSLSSLEAQQLLEPANVRIQYSMNHTSGQVRLIQLLESTTTTDR